MDVGKNQLERQFYLNLYRYAVDQCQPAIEERTGVRLGEVAVRDMCDFVGDLMEESRQRSSKGWLGFLRTPVFRLQARRLLRYYTEYARCCLGSAPAAYRRNTIYVSFDVAVMVHESMVMRWAIHELAHCLWEKLGGRFGKIGQRSRDKPVRSVAEGYALYAERIWFSDLYPPWMKRRLQSETLDETNIHVQAVRKIQGWVDRYGSQILLTIPKQWRRLK